MKHLILALTLLVSASSIQGQGRNELMGNKYFDEYSYDRAIRYLKTVKEKSIDINRKLAISYFKMEDFEQSEWYYTQVVNSNEVIVEDYFNYSQVLAMRENYPESVRWMTRYHERKSTLEGTTASIEADPEYYLDLIKEDNGYVVKNIEINSPEQEFGTNFYGDEIVFASSRTESKTIVRKWNWNQLAFLDIYKSELDTATLELGEPVAHHKKFNKKYHEGPATFNDAGDLMIFTSNNYQGRSSNDVVTLELFESRKEGEKWGKPIPFPFNSKEYSVGHGSLSKDGNTLYFVSDMPGSVGGTDIFRSHRKSNGEWGEPVHLDDEINTVGNEMFPFFHSDSVLFFASNGHPGLGGLDMFYIDVRELGINKVTNMNAPINSSRDDFAFIMNDDRTKGFFSSNRIGGMGNDDIYAFHREQSLKFNQLLRGKVIDEIGNIVPNVRVLLYDERGNVLSEVTTGDNGEYLFELKEGDSFALVGEKEGHSKGLNKIDTETYERDYVRDLMIRKPTDINSGMKPFDLEMSNLDIGDEKLVYKDFMAESPGLSLHSMIRDIRNGEPVPGSQISIYDKITGEETVLISPETGDNTWYLDTEKYANGRYSVKVLKEGYHPMEFDFDTPEELMGQHSFMAKLIPYLGPDEELDLDLAEVFDIGPIYFDLDKYSIREDARPELDKIVDLMKLYPDMVIDLTSHTDCRANKGYNSRLSDNRARSTAKYINQRVQGSDRITGTGLGEMNLVNDCECEGELKSDCSEEEHQRNRRTEFRIVKM
jgi:outer membrane protein OmpA-like peptidoglycan-associated protein